VAVLQPPAFSYGQYLSATAHLNTLQDVVAGLREEFYGPNPLFCGAYWVQDTPWTWEWHGYIRHRYDTLEYKVELENAGEFEIKVNDQQVATFNSAGVNTGSIDLSGLGLNDGEFYTVDVQRTGSDEVRQHIWYLRETFTPSYPTLADFLDEDTPTANQWQDLSNYADALMPVLRPPRPTNVVISLTRNGVVWSGAMEHRCQYLFYNLYMIAPYNRGNYPDPGGERYTEARIYIGGTLAAKFRVGDSGSADGSEYYEESVGGAGHQHRFYGLLDLDTYPGGLSLGQLYDVYVEMTHSTYWDTVKSVEVDHLYEVPSGSEQLPNWASFAIWGHGYYVYGNSNSPRARWIKRNLEELGAYAAYSNFPAMLTVQSRNGFWRSNVRRYRWLHYRNEEDASPKLVYTLNSELQEVSLPDASTDWLVVDLDSVPALYPGTAYRLENVSVAIEDLEP